MEDKLKIMWPEQPKLGRKKTSLKSCGPTAEDKPEITRLEQSKLRLKRQVGNKFGIMRSESKA